MVSGAVACPAATLVRLSGCQAARRPGGSRPAGGGRGRGRARPQLSLLGCQAALPYNPELGEPLHNQNAKGFNDDSNKENSLRIQSYRRNVHNHWMCSRRFACS